MPQVTIKYVDSTSLTMEEIVRLAETNYGKRATVEITADSSLPYDQIYWGIQQVITKEQLSLLFDKTCNYNKDIQKLRLSIIDKLEEIVDQVIVDNEAKVM